MASSRAMRKKQDLRTESARNVEDFADRSGLLATSRWQ
jgi:hypothetical protein